ncbi:sporulation protein YunB [Petroclostridium sp. X23]|uniref:sporulation protein YunB n=1 Tax=Petroclostridium sp. X23 TaxID=3045146 RepID=UPI0024AE5E2E|nr:sporulation protein YunB [Petroclostridium sp. X23]WHH59255.1 sporulation protein YunB [Petroclostridium sp. X23]
MGLWTRRGLAYRVKYRKRKNKGYNVFLMIALIILMMIYSLSVFDRKIRPTVVSIAEARAKYIASRAINEAVNEKIAEDNLRYEDLITFQKNNEGQIMALQANIIKMNQLKTAISMSIQQKIVNIDSTQINVPIGNVINSQMLAGWGPRIPVKLLPVGTAQADFKSSFQTAGINQTKHQILLEIHSNVSVLLPMIKSNSEVTTAIPVAETIIVGSVPDQYINVEGATTNPSDTILNMMER